MHVEEVAGFAARKREIATRLRSHVRRLQRALQAVDEDAARASRAAVDLHRAELLLPVASRIPRGAATARVPDWSQVSPEGKPAEVELQLDPALSASGNASRWLKRAKRYGAAAARIAARRAEVAAALERVEALLSRTESAEDRTKLASIENEAGPFTVATRRKKDDAERLPYRRFRSADSPILVGRSARDNDVLTVRVARGNDVWLHVRGMQGAHVIVPGAGEAPDARVLGDAALLAVHFSSARGADGVEVAWTRCKYVRKPKGAAPGSVLISQEKTLRVRQEPERLSALLHSEA
jgi:predicted ribosome quality control (RQC) complex YloA/Tae2 family protein